jgi:hypothetical protein
LFGKAIDLVVPGDPVRFVELAKAIGFSGIGLYVNDQNVSSAHLDTREAEKVATWGRIGSKGAPYVALDLVLEEVRKRGLATVVTVGTSVFSLTLLLLWFIFWRENEND